MLVFSPSTQLSYELEFDEYMFSDSSHNLMKALHNLQFINLQSQKAASHVTPVPQLLFDIQSSIIADEHQKVVWVLWQKNEPAVMSLAP